MSRIANQAPLAGLRVLELGSIPGGSYAARLFADFGAEVIRAEPPGGDPLRQRPPCIDLGHGRHEGAWFAVLNANKRCITLEPEDRSTTASLIAGADVLIDSLGDGERRLLGIDHAALAKACPELIILAPSWFGDSGPYRDYAATELVCRALAGMAYLVGPAEGPPMPLPDYQADILAGLNGFAAVCAAIHARADLGARRLELSTMEAAITLAEYNVALDWSWGRRDRRWGRNRFWPNYPLGIFRCKEGWLGVTVVTHVQWVTFCKLTGMDDLAYDPDYAVNRSRIAKSDELEKRFAPAFLTRTAQEWFRIGLEERMPFVVVPSIAELLEGQEFRRRGAFIETDQGGKVYEMPASILGLTACAVKDRNHVGDAGSDSPHWQAERASSAFTAAPRQSKNSLSGLRVVDLSMGWAGPFATRLLGDLGADIIKVEACGYPDWWRGVDNRPIVMQQRLYEKCGYFNVMNRNKRGITLDLTTPEGVELTKRLVADADIVVENYSASVLSKLGLDYAALQQVRPDLIMISMPAFPADGDWRELRAYGSTLEQAAGIPSVSGQDGAGPAGNHIAYGDPIGGVTAAAALMLALLHRNRTGEGQCINLSQVECSLPMVAPWIVEQSANGRITRRLGKGHPAYVPHGCFRCAGDDEWVLLAVDTDEQWRKLCSVIGRPEMAADATLSNRDGRRAREDEIDAAITAWTCKRSPADAMAALQAQGIPAGIAYRPIDLLGDPHLLARGFWQTIDREWSGPQPNPSPLIRETEKPRKIERAAPTLGQHNTEVLGGILGLTEGELTQLEEAGIIGTEAVPPHLRKARAAVGAQQPKAERDEAGKGSS